MGKCSTQGGQKTVLLQEIWSLIWGLGTKFRSSARVAGALHSGTISVAPVSYLFFFFKSHCASLGKSHFSMGMC